MQGLGITIHPSHNEVGISGPILGSKVWVLQQTFHVLALSSMIVFALLMSVSP